MLIFNGEVVKLEDIAKVVEHEMKLNSTGKIVNMFRCRNKMELLEKIIPFLSVGPQRAVCEAINPKSVHIYY